MTISINDGKGTPVAHVFSQDAQQNGPDPALLVNRANANGPSFWETVTSLVTLAKTAKQRNVQKDRLHIPVPGIIDGNPAVLGAIDVYVTIAADQAVSGVANLADAYMLTVNYLSNAAVKLQSTTLAPRVIP